MVVEWGHGRALLLLVGKVRERGEGEHHKHGTRWNVLVHWATWPLRRSRMALSGECVAALSGAYGARKVHHNDPKDARVLMRRALVFAVR
jgi:hypothetical protein